MIFSKQTRFLALGVIFFITITVIVFFVWPEIRLQTALRIYPDAELVSQAYGYYGANSGLKVLYYWTKDSLQNVQIYYEMFTPPFMVEEREGSIITRLNVDGSEQEINYAENLHCHYSMMYQCVNISLFTISQVLTDLPDLAGRPSASSNLNATPYMSKPLDSGTLIVYRYYVADY